MFALVSALAMAVGSTAQTDDAAETFPPRGWRACEAPAEDDDTFSTGTMSWFKPEGVFVIHHLKSPAAWPAAMVTDGDGKVVVRGDADDPLALTGLGLGDRYRVYPGQPEQRRFHLLDDAFIELPLGEFPTEKWKVREGAPLKLRRAKQVSPNSLGDLLQKKRHEISFRPKKPKHPCRYVLCEVKDDEADQIRSQSLSAALPFWMKARKGDTFRVYQLSPTT